MEKLKSKQQERSEKKKKKLAALINIVQLNDKDRMEATARKQQEAEINKNRLQDNDDGFVKVTSRKNNGKNKRTDDEPNNKRSRLISGSDDDGGASCDTIDTSDNEELQKLKTTLTQEEYLIYRRKLRERKRELENFPSLRLREYGNRALIELPQDKRTPLFLTDIQHLLMAALIGKQSPCTPDRWCFLSKPARLSHSVVLILEGLSLYHYLANESKFEKTNKIFDTRMELMLPPTKDGLIIEQMAQVPLTNVQAQQLIEQFGSLDTAIEMLKDPTLLVKAIFPIDEKVDDITAEDLHPGDKFPRTKLLLSALQMVDEGYPMPLRGELNQRFKTYVFTNQNYAPVHNKSPMYGVDCEMCLTAAGYNELTRISIVNEDLEIVYESLVMPKNKIINYLTRFSGITAEIMLTVTKDLNTVQREVMELLPPDAILVGQSLNSDLNAMRMMHPYCIDTSVCFNLTGVRKRKSKLRTLASMFLKENIQEFKGGHDSVEDSVAALKLIKMKLANNLEYGDEILMQKKRLQEILNMTNGKMIKHNLIAHAAKRDKRTAIISAGSIQTGIKEILKKAEEAAVPGDTLKKVTLYELESNKKAIKKAREIVMDNSLTLANLKLNPDQLFREDIQVLTTNTRDNSGNSNRSSGYTTIEQLDKWINKLWKSIAHNGMFLVLMGGSVECPSGLVKIAIKRNIADVAADTPLIV